MRDPNFEDHLRDTLGAYRTPFDTGALWNELEPLLAEDKKRRRGLVWWWVGATLALVLLAAACWGLSYYYENPGKGETPVAAMRGDKARPAQQDLQVEEICKELPTVVSKQTHTSGNTSTADWRNTRSGASPAIDALPSATQDEAHLNSQGAIHQAAESASTQEEVFATSTTINEKTSSADLSAVSPLEEIKKWHTPEQLATLSQLLKITPLPMSLHPLQARRKTKKHQSFLLQAEAGAGNVYKTLKSHPGDSLDQPYALVRKSTEEPLEYASATLLAGIEHRSGFYAKAGLGFTRINERFYVNSLRIEQDSISDGIVEIYIDTNGDSTFVLGDVGVTRYINYKKRTYNHYTMLELPVIAGYAWQNDRWSLAVEGGVFVNLSLKAEGDILSDDGTILSLKDDSIIRPSVGLSYYGAMRFGYKLNENIQVLLGPSLRVFPGSFTEKTYKLAQNYNLVGLSLGMNYRF